MWQPAWELIAATLLVAATIDVGGAAGDLRDKVLAVVSAHPEATVAVVVDDPTGGHSLELTADRPFHAASTMKIPVMIEIFRLAEAGDLSLDDTLLVENRFRSIVDGSLYSIEDDSNDAIYERLGSRMPIRDLVVQMITVSSNLATNLLIDLVSAESVQETCARLGAPGLRVLRGVEDLKAFEQGLSNETTARALATLLRHLADGTAVSREADDEMIAILGAQLFNEMIPAGLPPGTAVAHKTGQITRIHHDAAIVEPPGGAPYVLVVLIEGLDDEVRSAALGAEIARLVHAAIRP